VGPFVTDNRAIALQRPDRKDFMDHTNMLIAEAFRGQRSHCYKNGYQKILPAGN
jgi:hypothetical protein